MTDTRLITHRLVDDLKMLSEYGNRVPTDSNLRAGLRLYEERRA